MAAAEEVWQPRVFCLYCAITGSGRIESMPVFSNLMFSAVRWAARRGLREEQSFSNDAKKLEARRPGVRGEKLCLLVCAQAGVHIRSAELHSAWHKGRNRSRRLRWQDTGICGSPDADHPGGLAGSARTERHARKTIPGGSYRAAIYCRAPRRRMSLPVRRDGNR